MAWPTLPLGDLIELQRGYDLPEPGRRPGTVPVCGSAGVNGYHDTARAPGPGVTVGRSGASMGVVTYIRPSYWPHNTVLFVKNFKGNNPRFIAALLQQIQFKDLNSGSAQPSLNRNFLYPILVMKPPLEAQCRIAGILSVYDDLIEVNTRRIAILEEMAVHVFREWFVHLRFPGHKKVEVVETKNGLCPHDWTVTTLGDVANVQWGDTTKTKSAYVERGYPAYSATGQDGALPYFDFDCTGIVLSAIGANCGRTWFVEGKWACIKNTIRFWSTDANVSNEFLFYWTQQPDFWPRRGAAQPFISQGDARRCRILKPTPDVDDQFKSVVGPMLQLQATLQVQVSNLRNARDLILPRLISGEIDLFGTEREIQLVHNRAAAE